MQWARFECRGGVTSEEAWDELSQQGVDPQYSEENEDGLILYGWVAKELSLPEVIRDLTCVSAASIQPPPVIDWDAQWRQHAQGYSEGMLNVAIGEGKIVSLYPGCGFGDLSHPTTRLA